MQRGRFRPTTTFGVRVHSSRGRAPAPVRPRRLRRRAIRSWRLKGAVGMSSVIRPSKVGQWTEPALRVLRERYLTRKDGEVVETPEEMCWRVAQSIAAGEARYGRTPAAVDEIATAFYEMMIDQY